MFGIEIPQELAEGVILEFKSNQLGKLIREDDAGAEAWKTETQVPIKLARRLKWI